MSGALWMRAFQGRARFVMDLAAARDISKYMKAAHLLSHKSDHGGFRHPEARPVVDSASDLEKLLLAEIGRLGGEERRTGAEGALEAFRASLSQLVNENPRAYGAGDDAGSQRIAVSQLIAGVRTSFLRRTVTELREKVGYVLVFGSWIHRAVFTFVGFGLLAAVTLPLSAVSLMSTSAWGWLPGALGIVAALAVGAWILSRIRIK